VGACEHNKPQKSIQKVCIVNAGNQFQSKCLSSNLFYILVSLFPSFRFSSSSTHHPNALETQIHKRKKRGEEEDPFGLTAALDQMSFAQDIVMIESDPTKSTAVVEMSTGQVQPKAPETPAAPPQSDYPTATETVTSEPSSVTQVPPIKTTTPTPPSTSQSRAPTATTTPAKGIPEKTFNDPLRDLILLSEVILIDDEEEFLRNVKSLAEDSSCLDYVLEVKSTDLYNQLQQQRKQDLMKSSTLEQGISLFQNPKEMVDPVKEAEFLKTLEALEDTDDSDAVEKPVLGKISLVRRAKSAATRTSSDKRKTEENPLYNVAWEDIEVKR
jgi:transient receptor potential cation channel subfamily V member 6